MATELSVGATLRLYTDMHTQTPSHTRSLFLSALPIYLPTIISARAYSHLHINITTTKSSQGTYTPADKTAVDDMPNKAFKYCLYVSIIKYFKTALAETLLQKKNI